MLSSSGSGLFSRFFLATGIAGVAVGFGGDLAGGLAFDLFLCQTGGLDRGRCGRYGSLCGLAGLAFGLLRLARLSGDGALGGLGRPLLRLLGSARDPRLWP